MIVLHLSSYNKHKTLLNNYLSIIIRTFWDIFGTKQGLSIKGYK